jgi:curved DNA-binding protein CbpA
MMTAETYYETLGLAPFAEGAIVDQAYWHLAKTYQALVDTDPRARQALDDLNAAYAVLGTPRLREEYDAGLRPAVAGSRWRTSSTSPSTADKAPRGIRFALPKWPFGKAQPEESSNEDRILQLRTPAASQQAPRTAMQETGLPRTPRKGEVQDLHTSTARMLERWRASALAAAKASEPNESAPDMTLVDIFKTEEDIEAKEDPLAAVMDILKAPKGSVPAAPERS